MRAGDGREGRSDERKDDEVIVLEGEDKTRRWKCTRAKRRIKQDEDAVTVIEVKL